MLDKLGIIANRLAVGFIFAFVYQFIVGIATSLLSIPLRGDLHDLITGLTQIDGGGHIFIGWWVASTVIITTVALVILRLQKYISPYKGEKDLHIPPRITALTAVIIGAIISFLFFLLDLIIDMVGTYQQATDIASIYQAAMQGDFGPLTISIVFSIAAGFIIVGVASKTAKVKELTKDVGLSDIASLGRRMAKKEGGAKTAADAAGLLPGALVHIGEKKVDKVSYDIFEYDADGLEERHSEDIEECFVTKDSAKSFWINITGVHDADIIKKIGEYFGLHKLVQSDIMNTDIRSKIEIAKDYIFVVLKTPHFEKETGQIGIEQVSLVIGRNYVLSFQEIRNDSFEKIREMLREGGREARSHTNDYLAYLLTDAVVDSFFAIIERIGDRTDELEEELMAVPTPNTLQAIQILKRQLIILRKIVWPLRELIDTFERTTSDLVSSETKTYLRDAFNHAIQVMDNISSLRDMVGGMLDTYLSSMGNKMNEVMKTLTIIASIFIPITFIAGIYGTNFEYIPELRWGGGYFAMLIAMVVIVGGMLWWFKKRRWL